MTDLHRRERLKQMLALLAASSVGVPLTSALTGCASEPDPNVVHFWAMGSEAEKMAEILPAFYQQHPDIKVKVQQIPWTTAHEKLLTAYVGNSLPDMCQLGNTWIPEFSTLNVLEPLDPWLAKTPSVDIKDFFEGSLAANQIDSQTLGLPWYIDTRLLFYRKDMLKEAGFDKPPTTWAEWDTMLEAIKQKFPDRTPIFIPLVNEPELLLAFSYQQNESVLKDNNSTGNFNSKGFKTALNYYKSMFTRGYSDVEKNGQVNNLWTEFGNGRFAFFFSGPWNIGEIRTRLGKDKQDLWGTAPIPGPNGIGKSTSGGSSLVMFKKSQRKEAAWKFFTFLSQAKTQLELFKITGDLPPRRSAWNEGNIAADPALAGFLQQMEYMQPAPAVLEWERIVTKMQETAERVVRKSGSVDEAVVALDGTVDDILEKRRWMKNKGGK